MKTKIIFIFLILFSLAFINGCSSDNEEKLAKELSAPTTELNAPDEFEITNISKKGKFYSIELNNNLTINGFEILDNTVELPGRLNKKNEKKYFLNANSDRAENFIERLKTAIFDFHNNKSQFNQNKDASKQTKEKSTPKKLELSNIEVSLFDKPGPIKAFVNLVSKDGILFSSIIIKSNNNSVFVDWPKLEPDKIEVFNLADAENKKDIEKIMLQKFEEKSKLENFKYQDTTADKQDNSNANFSSNDNKYQEKQDKRKNTKEFSKIVITKNDGDAIEINNALKITNLKIENGEVIFPTKKSKDGKEHLYITADKNNPDKYSEFITNIKTKKTTAAAKAGKLEVSFVSIKDAKFAKVGINQTFVIENFYIDKDGAIKWPSIKTDDGFKDVIIPLNSEFKDKVETTIKNKLAKSTDDEDNKDNNRRKKKDNPKRFNKKRPNNE